MFDWSEELTTAVDVCVRDLRLCVRFGLGKTVKPEGELKMEPDEFIKWVREKQGA